MNSMIDNIEKGYAKCREKVRFYNKLIPFVCVLTALFVYIEISLFICFIIKDVLNPGEGIVFMSISLIITITIGDGCARFLTEKKEKISKSNMGLDINKFSNKTKKIKNKQEKPEPEPIMNKWINEWKDNQWWDDYNKTLRDLDSSSHEED